MKIEDCHNVLKCYMVGADGSTEIDAQTFLPSVAYIKEGKIIDMLFDSFIFLPQPNYLYDYAPGGTNDRKPMNKEQWETYIVQEEFMPEKNVNALEEAVGKAKDALNLPDYRAKVFFSLFYPHSLMRDFGEVNGESLDLADVEGKKKALRWMVDRSVEEFRKGNYKNIEIGGFYWFTESIMRKPEEKNEEFLRDVTDYIRSLGYCTIWSVYFNAYGHERWKEIGFDAAGYQPNYFPEHKNWPNQGKKDRLAKVSEAVRALSIGVELEMADFVERSAEVIKEYYEEGVSAGWDRSFHIYYMSTGPKLIARLSETDQPVLHGAYDDTYRFIKGTFFPGTKKG